MKKHLRLFSWILSLTLLCELLPIAAFAQSDVGEAAAVTLATLLEETNSTESTGKCGDNLTYTLSADGVLTISGTGEMYDFATIESQISDTVKECPWKRENLKKIILNEGVTSIGSQAFCVDPYQGSPLDTVILPDSLLSIGNNAFLNCNHLDAITLPNHLTSIGTSAYWHECISIFQSFLSQYSSKCYQLGRLCLCFQQSLRCHTVRGAFFSRLFCILLL